MADWTTIVKIEILDQLAKAEIDPKSPAGKTILAFEKRINSMRNMLHSGSSMQYCYESPAGTKAYRLGTLLNLEHGETDALHEAEWDKYKKANGYSMSALCVGDFMA